MHYRDGTPAKLGDVVKWADPYNKGTELVGVVEKLTPGADTCNAQIVPLAKVVTAEERRAVISLPTASSYCATTKDCDLVL